MLDCAGCSERWRRFPAQHWECSFCLAVKSLLQAVGSALANAGVKNTTMDQNGNCVALWLYENPMLGGIVWLCTHIILYTNSLHQLHHQLAHCDRRSWYAIAAYRFQKSCKQLGVALIWRVFSPAAHKCTLTALSKNCSGTDTGVKKTLGFLLRISKP